MIKLKEIEEQIKDILPKADGRYWPDLEAIWLAISTEIIAYCHCGYEVSFLDNFMVEMYGIYPPCECREAQ